MKRIYFLLIASIIAFSNSVIVFSSDNRATINITSVECDGNDVIIRGGVYNSADEQWITVMVTEEDANYNNTESIYWLDQILLDEEDGGDDKNFEIKFKMKEEMTDASYLVRIGGSGVNEPNSEIFSKESATAEDGAERELEKLNFTNGIIVWESTEEAAKNAVLATAMMQIAREHYNITFEATEFTPPTSDSPGELIGIFTVIGKNNSDDRAAGEPVSIRVTLNDSEEPIIIDDSRTIITVPGDSGSFNAIIKVVKEDGKVAYISVEKLASDEN